MKNSAKVSVIIPVYNAEKYLEKCLRSLIKQSFLNHMEIIAVDDGSTDGSSEIIEQYASMHEQITTFHIANSGVSNARNYGISKASGEYITFVDSDDWVEPNCYEHLYTKAITSNADIVASGLYFDNDTGTFLTISTAKEDMALSGAEAVRRYLSGRLDVHVCNKLFARSVAAHIAFNPEIRMAEDSLYLCECLMNADKVYLTNEIFYHYYQNTNSAMNQVFGEKNFEALCAYDQVCKLTQNYYPEWIPYAECLRINMKCRILGELSLLPDVRKRYCNVYQQLRKDVREFDISKSIQYSSRKHWAALMIAKLSPRLYGVLRTNKTLRFKKG